MSALPKWYLRYSKFKSVHARFMRWARSRVWERLFADLVADKKNVYLKLDYKELDGTILN